MSGKVTYAGGPTARYAFLAVVFGLSVLGLVMIYSASSVTAAVREGSSEHYFLRQLLFFVTTGTAAILISRFDYRVLRDQSRAVWGISLLLLVATLALGAVRGGARRWLPLGLFSLQPSEVAKIACVIVVAALAVEWQRGKIDTQSFLRKSAVTVLAPAFLIMLQPDMGTTLTLAVAVAFVLFLAGIEMRWVFIAGSLLVATAALMVRIAPYRMARYVAFLDPWADPLDKGYQTIQALLAFGTGGVGGVGLGLSRQKFFYLPEAHTDFILAIIGEEVGLIGTFGVVAAFAVLIWAGFKIATGAKDPFGRLVAGGLTGMLGFQALLNMAAVTGLMPVTGKPLPFLSYGGSSMLVTMVCVGLILSVSQYGAYAPRPVKVRPARPRKEESIRESNDERGRNRRPHPSRANGGRAVRRRA